MHTQPQPIFTGVRVADFSWVIAAPLATQYLAIHGAEVIRIESSLHPDTLRFNQPMVNGIGLDNCTYYAGYNMGKLGLSLDLRRPEAIRLAKVLVASCDVVAENFTPGAMDRLGLGYETLRQVRPDVIMLSLSLGGQTGPERSYKGYGTVIQASSGVTHLTGWPDRPPAGTGVAYTDFLAGPIAGAVLIAALEHRRRSGEGQYIDLSEQEAALYGLDAALLDQTVNGVTETRAGNRHPAAAPHGVYPCLGDDRWLTIAVFGDAQWDALVETMGRPDWALEERFTTLLGRKANEKELDGLMAAWTEDQESQELMRRLQAADVPAGAVQDTADLHDDPQLCYRGHFLDLDHPIFGSTPFDALPYRLDGSTPLPPRPAPLIGQHNRAILQELLGLSASEYEALERDGVLQ